MGLLGSLGSLNVLLSADTAQFSSAMDKAAFTAERDLQRISRSAKLNGQIMTATLLAAATGFAVKMKNITDSADKMGKMAQSFGITVEELSKLKYAADLSDVSLEDMQSAFARMNKTAFESPRIFERFGVAVKNASGNYRSGYDILLDFSDVIAAMPDGVGKANAITQAFGKSAAGMTPLFNSGSKGLREFAAEAERTGNVISTSTALSAELLNDNMTRLTKNIDGAFFSIGSTLIPILADLSENMKTSAERTGEFEQAGKGLGSIFVAIANAGMVMNQTLESAGEGFGTFAVSINEIIHGNFKQAMDAWVNAGDKADKDWEGLAANLQKNWDLLTDKSESSSKKMKESMSGPMDKFTKEMQDHYKRIDKLGQGIGNSFGRAFDDAILEGKKFRDVMVSLLQDIEAAMLKSMVTQPLAEAIGAGISAKWGTAAHPNSNQTKIVSTTAVARHGNIFSDGNLIPFASGGLINRPSIFPMANGGVGLAGEAGPEAIMPLFRNGNGDLGVKSGGSGGGVEINVYAPEGSRVSQNRQTVGNKDQINIMIDEAVSGAVGNPGSKTYKSLRNSFGLKQSLAAR